MKQIQMSEVKHRLSRRWLTENMPFELVSDGEIVAAVLPKQVMTQSGSRPTDTGGASQVVTLSEGERRAEELRVRRMLGQAAAYGRGR